MPTALFVLLVFSFVPFVFAPDPVGQSLIGLYGYPCACLKARGAPEHAKARFLDFSAVCGENSARQLAGK